MALEMICGYKKRRYAKGFEPITGEELKMNLVNFRNPCTLLAPPFSNPFNDNNNMVEKYNSRIGIQHGTTTLGFVFKGGAILCADSRGTAKKFVGSQDLKKVIEFNKFMIGTMAGGAADCSYWDRVLLRESRLHQLRFKRALPVDTATRMLCNVSNQYRGMGLMMGMLLAGWTSDGPQLSYVDSDGLRIYADCFAVGSGASTALGILDLEYKYDMSAEAAFEVAQRAIYMASHTDAFSGGIIRLYHIDENGWKMISNVDCNELHSRFQFYSITDRTINVADIQPEPDAQSH